MSPLLIPLIGPVINGIVELVSDPKKFTAETVKTKTTAIAPLAATASLALAQTEDQAIASIISGVISLALFFYKKKTA